MIRMSAPTLGERALLVERPLGPDGSLKPTKTADPQRPPAGSAQRRPRDLAQGPPGTELIFPVHDGTAWDEDDCATGATTSTCRQRRRRGS